MPQNELVFRMAGAAGDGGTSTAESFAKICTRSGLYAFTYTSYQSVIRVRRLPKRFGFSGASLETREALTPPLPGR